MAKYPKTSRKSAQIQRIIEKIMEVLFKNFQNELMDSSGHP